MSFLQGCIRHTAVHGPTLMHAALSGLGGFKRKRHKKSEGNSGGIGGEGMEGMDLVKILYAHNTFSNAFLNTFRNLTLLNLVVMAQE